MKVFRGIAFYILLAVVSTVVVLFPIDDQVAIVILLEFLTKDPQKVSEIGSSSVKMIKKAHFI